MRGQSHVVGFTLVLGFGVVALGLLTVSIGGVMESHATHVDTSRVATDIEDTLQVVDRTGSYTHRMEFTEGQLRTTERNLRVLAGGTVVHSIETGGLVFESGQRRVVGVAGAVVHDTGSNAWLKHRPPLISSEPNEVLVIGAPVLGMNHTTITGNSGNTVTLQSDISHERTTLGEDEFTVAIETTTPGPLERYFQGQNASTERRRFGDDKHESVVATFPDERTGYLVVHRLDLEVTNG